MAKVKITWYPYESDPFDVVDIHIIRSNYIKNARDMEDFLNADGEHLGYQSTLRSYEPDSLVFAWLTKDNGITDLLSHGSYTDETAKSGFTYYYYVAVRNLAGWKVGAEYASDANPALGEIIGAVTAIAV